MPKFNPHPLVFDGPAADLEGMLPCPATDQPLLATILQACKTLNCGRTTVFALLNDGILERRKIGRATRVTVASIKKLAGQ